MPQNYALGSIWNHFTTTWEKSTYRKVNVFKCKFIFSQLIINYELNIFLK
jgi:hypothetical protein